MDSNLGWGLPIITDEAPKDSLFYLGQRVRLGPLSGRVSGWVIADEDDPGRVPFTVGCVAFCVDGLLVHSCTGGQIVVTPELNQKEIAAYVAEATLRGEEGPWGGLGARALILYCPAAALTPIN